MLSNGPDTTQALRLLVVDDNEGDFVFTRELLSDIEDTEYTLDWASDGQSALRIMEKQEHDLYLLDHQLGSLNGVQVLEEVRRREINKPVIMLTGMSDRLLDRTAMTAGACDYLVKSELTSALLERSIRYAVERARLVAELDASAKRDGLTGLANRRYFNDFLDGAIARALRGASHLGLLFIDLDRFKEINDRFGHDVGDRLLVEVSHTLTQCVRRGDMVSRLGGDEFAVILDSVGSTQNAEAVGKKILETLTEKSIVVGSRSINVGASIGLAVFPDHAEDAESLIKAADTAMYAVKTAGRNNLQSYGGEMQSEALRRTEIHQALGEALPKGEFSLHYQPQVVGLSGRITGVEALLRWTPESGPIGPDVFIPVAEEQDLISPIGAWVLRTACEQYCGWRDHGILPEKLVLGVNVSAGQLARGNEFPEAIERLLEEFDMQPGTLELEITETAVMHDARTAIEELRRINALGVRIALDDFGTGYSSRV